VSRFFRVGLIVAIIKWIVIVLVMLWASRGVLLLLGAIMGFAKNMIPLSPDAVESICVGLFFHLGIPCILLYFLLRDRKHPGVST